MKYNIKNIPIVWMIRRLFGLIMFFIFVEFYRDTPLLIGEKGLVPFKEQMDFSLAHYGLAHSMSNFPTLFWLNNSNNFIHLLAIVGLIVSFLIFISFEWFVLDILLWIIYGSFLQCLALFTDINDYVIMECVFLFIFFFPWKLTPTFKVQKKPMQISVLGFYFFIFKLILGMLLFKLMYHSPLWYNLTFLKYFYSNSPIPAPLSYFLYQLPMWFHKICTFLVFVLQAIICLFIFVPKKYRQIAFYCTLLIQLPILLVTNLGGTNVALIVISFLLLIDLDELEKIDYKKNIYAWIIFAYCFFASTLLLTHFHRPESNHLSNKYLLYQSPTERNSLIEKAEIYLFRYKIEYILARFSDVYRDQRDIAFAYSSDGVNFHESSLKYSLGEEQKAPVFLWTSSFGRLRIPLFHYLKNPDLPSWRTSFYYKFPWYEQLISKAYLDFNYFNENFLDQKIVCESECRYFKLRLYRFDYTNINELFSNGKWWNRSIINESQVIDLKNPPKEFPQYFYPTNYKKQ